MTSTFFREGAKADWDPKVVLCKCADVSSTSRVLEVWDRVEGPFRLSAEKFEDELRQVFEVLELPFDPVSGK
jgi:hypothetical protein